MTPGGDQNYEAMAKDRRYTHYLGRPLNRFEPDKQHGSTQATTRPGPGPLAAVADLSRKEKKKKERRAELVFDSSMPSLAELHSLDDGDDD